MRSYYYSLVKGEYVNNLIRCMFVGHWGVGKTTLVKGLLEEDQTGITSTDGIEVHVRRCYYDKQKRGWHIQGMFYTKTQPQNTIGPHSHTVQPLFLSEGAKRRIFYHSNVILQYRCDKTITRNEDLNKDASGILIFFIKYFGFGTKFRSSNFLY